MKNPEITEEDLIAHLRGKSDRKLLAIMEKVLNGRQPFPNEADYIKSAYFVGVGVCLIEEGTWTLYAVASPDNAIYGQGAGSNLSEEGVCPNCNVELRASLKNVLCPICGSKAFLT